MLHYKTLTSKVGDFPDFEVIFWGNTFFNHVQQTPKIRISSRIFSS